MSGYNDYSEKIGEDEKNVVFGSEESQKAWNKIIEIRDIGQEDPRRRRRIERSHQDANIVEGVCYKCGKSGHYPFQCFNFKNADPILNEPVSPGVSSSEERKERKRRKKEKKKRKKKMEKRMRKKEKKKERKKRKREIEVVANECENPTKKRKLD